MQNLFYVPPHQPHDIHPRTPGIKSGARRGQPERLGMSAAPAGLVTGFAHRTPPLDGYSAPVAAVPKPSLRAFIGRSLIRLGEWITPQNGLNGQPLGQS